MMKRIFLILCIVAGFVGSAHAQYYDAEDEICFYVQADGNGSDICVFNFDGERATDFYGIDGLVTVRGCRDKLAADRNFFEKRINDVTFDMEYCADLSSDSTSVYSVRRYGYFGHLWTACYYYFSDNRETLVKKESMERASKGVVYKRVSKSYFTKDLNKRGRSN